MKLKFQQVNTNNALPARAPPTTPKMMENLVNRGAQDEVTIPYSLTNAPWTQNPAVSTEAAVFYAVNPYWQVFQAFLEYCNDPNDMGKLQLIPTSSFAGITIWRVYPYVYCPPSQQAGCYEDIFSGIKIPGSTRPRLDMRDCNKTIDFLVTGMEYIDVENVAISILRTTPSNIDPQTLQPINKSHENTSTVTYFINTVTMQIREGVAWSSEVPQAVYTQGQLCPTQRRMPVIGSMVSEVLAASIFFVKMPFNLVLNGVYVFRKWSSTKDGDRCPLITRGHTLLLKSCNTNIFSLEDFFDSIERASQMLYRSISLVARLFNGLPGSATSITFINGIKMYGESSINPLTSYMLGPDLIAKPLSSIPIQDSAVGLFSGALRMPSFMRLIPVPKSFIKMSDFLYHFVVDLIYRIVRASFTGQSPSYVFYQTMYNFEERYTKGVTLTTQRGCTGLSLAFGYTNPWAMIIRHQCDAWAAVPSNVLTFLNVFLLDIPIAKCMCKDAQVIDKCLCTCLCVSVRDETDHCCAGKQLRQVCY